MRVLKFGLLISVTVLCCSCSLFSSKPELNYKAPSVSADGASSKAAESSRKGDIVINIKADSQLNRYQNRPHALHICIYQLKDPNG